MSRPIVVIESPYSGNVLKNRAYLEDALYDCLDRGEAPFASHGIYPSVLNDLDPKERDLGMEAGWAFYKAAAKCVAYIDLGISEGMQKGINKATEDGVAIEYRKLGGWS